MHRHTKKGFTEIRILNRRNGTNRHVTDRRVIQLIITIVMDVKTMSYSNRGLVVIWTDTDVVWI